MRWIFFILLFLSLSCEKKASPIYPVGSEKIVEISDVRIEWTDGKNRISAFPERVTYAYNEGEVFFSSLTGVITNSSGKRYFVEGERGVYREETKEGEAEGIVVKSDEGIFNGDSIFVFFSSPITMVLKGCDGKAGRFSLSAEECRIFPEEEMVILFGNVKGSISEEKK